MRVHFGTPRQCFGVGIKFLGSEKRGHKYNQRQQIFFDIFASKKKNVTRGVQSRIKEFTLHPIKIVTPGCVVGCVVTYKKKLHPIKILKSQKHTIILKSAPMKSVNRKLGRVDGWMGGRIYRVLLTYYSHNLCTCIVLCVVVFMYGIHINKNNKYIIT